MVREFRENDEHEESLDDDIREQDDIEHLNKTESEFRQTLSENDKTIANETSLPLLLNDALRFVPVKDDPLLISAVRELAQIRDTATLEMELEKFPHLREKLEFRLMYSTCETYFKASHYRDALYRSETTFGAIAATLTTYPEQIRRWLVLELQPPLLWLLDYERKRMVDTQKPCTLQR